jgi:AcrR family transcriptional regulator
MPRVKTLSDNDLLDQALEVLLEKGPGGFTLPAVGRTVGLSPSTLIQRFGSKRGLLDRVLARSTAHLETALQDRPQTGAPRRDLVDWVVSLSSPQRTPAHVAGNLTLLKEDITDPARRVAAQHHTGLMREGIAAYLAAIGSPSPATHARMFEAHWTGLVLQWAMVETDQSIDAWLEDGLGSLLTLLVPPAPKPQ